MKKKIFFSTKLQYNNKIEKLEKNFSCRLENGEYTRKTKQCKDFLNEEKFRDKRKNIFASFSINHFCCIVI